MVVVHGAVVRRVVDVEVVEPRRVHGREGRRDRQPLLLGRAVRGRHVRPAGRRIERDPEVVDAERVRPVGLPRDVVVEQDPAAREERPEIHDRPLERRRVAARRDPLDRDDVLACALGGLTERASAWSTPGAAKLVELLKLGSVRRWNVLFVEPCTPGHAPVARVAQPTPGVRREALSQAVVPANALVDQGPCRWACCRASRTPP